MSIVMYLWVTIVVLGATVVVQWVAWRKRCRSELAKQHAKYVQHHQTWSRHAEQVKRQIAQLQHDLASARLQVKRLPTSGTAIQWDAGVNAQIERELDASTASRPALPVDGFAETRPAPYAQREASLLIR